MPQQNPDETDRYRLEERLRRQANQDGQSAPRDRELSELENRIAAQEQTDQDSAES